MINKNLHNIDYASISDKTSGKKIFWLCFCMGVLLFLRAINTIFLYPAFIIGIIVVLFSSPDSSLCMLFFTLPLGPIFKLSPESFSFFTVLFMVYVVKLFVLRSINIRTFFLILLFGGYLLLFSGVEQLISIVTLLVGFLLVYFTLREKNIEFEKIIISYAFGLLEASVLGLMQDQLPIVKEYVVSELMKIGEGNYVDRFSGLHGNPNYFTVDIIIALAGLAILVMIKKHSIINIVLFGFLSVVGFLSVSKSFLLTWLIMFVWVIISSFQMQASKMLKAIIIIACSFAVIYIFAASSIDLYVVRFFGVSKDSASEMTTGRTDIWVNYIHEILSNTKTLFLGTGIGGKLVNGDGAHNTYIELWYMLGFIGSILYLCMVHSCIKVNNKRPLLISCVPLVVFLVRLFAIGILLYDSIWFYMIVVGLALKEGQPQREEVDL